MHANPRAFRFFRRSQGIGAATASASTARAREAGAVGAGDPGLVRDPGLRGDARVRFSMALQLTGLTGEGAGPWIQAQLTSSRRGKPTTRPSCAQTADWQRYSRGDGRARSPRVLVEVGLMSRRRRPGLLRRGPPGSAAIDQESLYNQRVSASRSIHAGYHSKGGVMKRVALHSSRRCWPMPAWRSPRSTSIRPPRNNSSRSTASAR